MFDISGVMEDMEVPATAGDDIYFLSKSGNRTNIIEYYILGDNSFLFDPWVKMVYNPTHLAKKR